MPMIWAFVAILILSWLTKNIFLGILLGFLAAPVLGLLFSKITSTWQAKKNDSLFLIVTFEVLGHLSKSKGQVTKEDINIATHIMNQLSLDADKRVLAQHSFNHGKSHDYPLEIRLNELYQHYRHRQDVLKFFCEHLLLAAMSDGKLHVKEEQILYKIAAAFNIPQPQMAMFIEMMMASYQFQHGGRYQSNNSYQQERQHQYNSSQRNYRQNDINYAYKVLGVNPSDEVTIIKRAYRKLMNEHHPDKLMSKGLPQEMLEAAKKRAQEIQAAYDAIKTDRGFK